MFGSLIKPRLSAEITRYLESASFLQQSRETQKKHRWLLKILDVRFGHQRVNKISTRAIDEMMADEMHRPGTANNLLSLLRRLMRLSVRRGQIAADPTEGVRPLRIGKVHTWTESEIALFETRWPRGSAELFVYRAAWRGRGKRAVSGAVVRLAFDLLLWTDQRRADVAKLLWSDIYGGRVNIVQKKTGTELSLPFHKELQLATEGLPRGNGRVLTTPGGRDFTAAEMGYFMTAAIRAAGLPARCKPHGLRKSTLRRMAEKGGTAHHLKSVSGHKDLREVSVYTEAADQMRLSDDAFKLIERPDAPRNDQ